MRSFSLVRRASKGNAPLESPLHIWLLLPKVLCDIREAVFRRDVQAVRRFSSLVQRSTNRGLRDRPQGPVNQCAPSPFCRHHKVTSSQMIRSSTRPRPTERIGRRRTRSRRKFCKLCQLLPLTHTTRWEQALATGDPNVAEENLRRFFEQHFHDGNDS